MHTPSTTVNVLWSYIEPVLESAILDTASPGDGQVRGHSTQSSDLSAPRKSGAFEERRLPENVKHPSRGSSVDRPVPSHVPVTFP
ncbi:uncharacterized protein SPSK_10169 [Sporothrix schenckii 1099-18]|uniref:Uncharacterized protein n=1 Tax=Sporothrix schenckii 1099-18 TaxID=1397361 RepID=A0A0F2M8M5_SPOSC|nr:uncharacterized protein SPSK_10169 [Sporothrix schenckii 1099-18]KJR84521.1 hypothetical protein SPSK_10169 [Sporothrix schenckii 1099-18]